MNRRGNRGGSCRRRQIREGSFFSEGGSIMEGRGGEGSVEKQLIHTFPQQTFYIWKTQRDLPYKVTACALLIDWKVRQTDLIIGE